MVVLLRAWVSKLGNRNEEKVFVLEAEDGGFQSKLCETLGKLPDLSKPRFSQLQWGDVIYNILGFLVHLQILHVPCCSEWSCCYYSYSYCA